MKNRSSLTAEYMSLFRALESSRPTASRLFNDPFAHLFLHQWRKAAYSIAKFELGRSLVEKLLDRSAPGARAAGIARTKWIDDEVEKALATTSQLVLLGAGFDTRAYRLSAGQRSIVFELDHPETSRAKRAVLQRELRSLPNQVRFVEIDFNQQSITEALAQDDFDFAQPACFIWEGVTNYLSADAVDGGLRQIAQAAVGSFLLFTYIHPDVLNQPQRFFGGEQLTARLQRYGEPWTFGLHPEEIQSYLSARGLQLIKDAGVAEIWQNVGRSVLNTRGYEFYRLASARVQR